MQRRKPTASNDQDRIQSDELPLLNSNINSRHRHESQIKRKPTSHVLRVIVLIAAIAIIITVNSYVTLLTSISESIANIPDARNDSTKDQPHQRTTEEANQYMAMQASRYVDGEKALKAEMKELQKLQIDPKQSQKYKSAKTVSRWLDYENETNNEPKISYWLPNDATKQDEAKWTETVQTRMEMFKEKDKIWHPSLYQEDNYPSLEKEEMQEPTKTHQYPSPADMLGNPNAKVILKPSCGHHRHNVDAIFALAEGYDLNTYLGFIEPLKATGFTGDLVISVSSLDSLASGVEKYLRTMCKDENEENDGLNVVLYSVKWKKENDNWSQLVGMFGDGDDGSVLDDPREARPVATARYELYWAWSLKYDPNNWIMLIDSRDTHFQSNPFVSVERRPENDGDGILYFFGEHESVNLKASPYNRKWLTGAYGQNEVSNFLDENIICSGSTMGEQAGIEAYTRAMISQFDETKCKMKGCDQGFHNYLYYSGILHDTIGIEKVELFDQGMSIINNLGVLRSKPLKEWGLLDTEKKVVLNWDGTVSAVAHQVDRDGELNNIIKEFKRKYYASWMNQ